jgi:hypothetical protein
MNVARRGSGVPHFTDIGNQTYDDIQVRAAYLDRFQ